MKVLHVLGGKGHVGGAETVVAAIAGGDDAASHAVIAPFADRSSVAELAALLGDTPLEAWGITQATRLPAARGRLVRHVARTGFDVVHAHLFHAAALVASLDHDVPRVLTHHHGLLFVDRHRHRHRRRHVARRVDKWAGRRFDRVVAVSNAVATFLHETYGYPWDLLEVIPNGWTGQPQEPRVPPTTDFLTVGRLRAEKGHAVLLHAFAAARADEPDLRLRFVGDGPRRRALEGLAADLGVLGNVEFMGAAADVWVHYAEAAVVVVPSLTEAQGLVVLEAMAAGRPVIASRVGGIPEMVEDGRTGRLVPAGDAEALSRAMLEVHRSSELRERLGTAARELAQEWRMEHAVERYHDLYRRLAG